MSEIVVDLRQAIKPSKYSLPFNYQTILGELTVSQLIETVPALEPIELRQLYLYSHGLSVPDIAAKMHRSRRLVKERGKEIVESMGARNTAHAVWLGFITHQLMKDDYEFPRYNSKLTPTELIEWAIASQGHTVDTISRMREVGYGTSKDHRNSTLRKLYVLNINQGMRRSFEFNIFPLEDPSQTQ